MKTNHVNFVDQSGRIYCYKLNEIVPLTEDHYRICDNCPYFYDTAHMQGVECVFDDHCNEGDIEFLDPAESEKHSMYQYVRLGMKTKAEVDAMLKGDGAEETSEEELYPEDEGEENGNVNA